MKKTLAVGAAFALLGFGSMAYAQSGYDNGYRSTDGTWGGRAVAVENQNNNQPGTTAGTPTHSVPANSANTGTANLFNSARTFGY